MYLYIRGMSDYLDHIRDKISDRSVQIDQHIIRLLLYPNSSYCDHWMHEIWAFLHDVDKVKGKNKFPKSKMIYDALATHNDILDNYVTIVKDIEHKLTPEDVSLDTIASVIVQYQFWLSKKLSTAGVVTIAEVKSKLKEII